MDKRCNEVLIVDCDKTTHALGFIENKLVALLKPKQCQKCKLLYTPLIQNQIDCIECDLYKRNKYIPESTLQDFPSEC